MSDKPQETSPIVTYFLLFILMFPGLSLLVTALADVKSPLAKLQEPDTKKSYLMLGEKIVKKGKKNARKNNKNVPNPRSLATIPVHRFISHVPRFK